MDLSPRATLFHPHMAAPDGEVVNGGEFRGNCACQWDSADAWATVSALENGDATNAAGDDIEEQQGAAEEQPVESMLRTHVFRPAA